MSTSNLYCGTLTFYGCACIMHPIWPLCSSDQDPSVFHPGPLQNMLYTVGVMAKADSGGAGGVGEGAAAWAGDEASVVPPTLSEGLTSVPSTPPPIVTVEVCFGKGMSRKAAWLPCRPKACRLAALLCCCLAAFLPCCLAALLPCCPCQDSAAACFPFLAPPCPRVIRLPPLPPGCP